MYSNFLRREPADRAWAEPGRSGGGQVEVLPVHVIQGLYKTVLLFISTTDTFRILF